MLNAHGAAIIANYIGPNVRAQLTPLNGPGRSEFTRIELCLFHYEAEWKLAPTSIEGPVLPASNRRMVHTANFVSVTEDCIAVATAEDGRSNLDAGVGAARCGVEVQGRGTGNE